MSTTRPTDVVPITRVKPRPAPRVGAPDLDALAQKLAAQLDGEVRFDAGSLALYATDGSNYRQLPMGVVIPRHKTDVLATIDVCREFGAPLLSRGGGTSLAGQCCNFAVVMDMSKYLHGILELDASGRRARVLPGTVLDVLRGAANRHDLTFGPDPSTHNHCTLGGMIGNNSCGVHSVMSGRTSENVEELEVATYDGLVMRAGPTPPEALDAIVRQGGRRADIYGRMKALIDRVGPLVRARYPKIPRRVSGYNLDELLPENGFNVARALVGSEGTLVTVLEATVRLVPWPRARTLLVLGYPDITAAADHVPAVLEEGPIGLEAIDQRLIDDMRKKGLHDRYLAYLPDGHGFLMAEFGGDSREEADARARDALARLQGAAPRPNGKIYDDPDQERKLWEVRKSGLGATARIPGAPDSWEGWEDSAVPPHRMGDYLRELRPLMQAHGYGGAFYGHFGQGCLHTRINFDLTSAAGIAKYRNFVEEAADLVIRLGGSLSGEHGDGQSRGELLVRMFGPDLVAAFRELKAIWDPAGRMNPGKVVDPYKIDQNLRLGADYRAREVGTHFSYPDDDGDFARATLRCVGVGECRRAEGGTMCPSFRATREEMHSTRGRAHLLFEMMRGDRLADGQLEGWRDPHVHESLDLCLACKGCKNDCPLNVDVATYKAEFLAHHYQGRLRPAPAYAMGLIHDWARLAALAPGVANTLSQAPLSARLLKRIGGLAPERPIPPFAARTFKALWRQRPAPSVRGPEVLLWPDTFNDHFFPGTLLAAAEVLESLGYRVTVPRGDVCCGRPLYDFGMLDRAKRLLRKDLRALASAIEAGTPVVGLEPSCVSVFRDEMVNLLPHDEDARRLKKQTYFFAEFLTENTHPERLPRLAGKAAVHGHCHEKSLLGGTDHGRRLLEALGLDVQVLQTGCCGLAGSFGFERGEKFRVSQKIGELDVFPKVRDLDVDTLLVGDGFSCREQIDQGTARRPLHVAEVARLALNGHASAVEPARLDPRRPAAVAALALAGLVAGPLLARGRLRATQPIGRRLSGGWTRRLLGAALLAGAGLAALAASVSGVRRER
ncbi:MAG TPA: FAD-binding and (Fe-S)-binding domain-containing protein [Polyangia bacterium]|nr:FAD-binding and (Fe-S)-binding domain-containing protein [Polyangia bacterium]